MSANSMTLWIRQYASVIGAQGEVGPYQNLVAAADRLDMFYMAAASFRLHARLPQSVTRSKRVTVPVDVYHQICAALAEADGE